MRSSRGCRCSVARSPDCLRSPALQKPGPAEARPSAARPLRDAALRNERSPQQPGPAQRGPQRNVVPLLFRVCVVPVIVFPTKVVPSASLICSATPVPLSRVLRAK